MEKKSQFHEKFAKNSAFDRSTISKISRTSKINLAPLHCKVIQKLLSIYEKLLQQEGYRLKIDLNCGDATSLIHENVGLFL